MNEKDREFILSLPKYPMEFVGKLPNLITYTSDTYKPRDKEGKTLLSVKRSEYVFEDGTIMKYWEIDNE